MDKSTCSWPLLLLSIFGCLFHLSAVGSVLSYKSVNILLNCGISHDTVDAYNRRWSNDSDTLFGPSNLQDSFSSQATYPDLSGVPPVPYLTARIFTSASSHKFIEYHPNGRHFVRLHFFPAFYNDRDTENALFSVTTEPYTLLNNFNPTTATSNLQQLHHMHEFFITVPFGSLTLTFTPSSSTPHSYASINGIEIVSSPELFFSSASIVPTHQSFSIRDSDALQTIIRLNVGGKDILPTADSNLSRTWHDDSPYIIGGGFGVSYTRDNNVSIRYSKAVPEYIAPLDVYGTARSIGLDTSVNLNYNLTWFITVDNGFRYLIRLHFCEIQSKVYKENQRVFNVYVNGMIANPRLDVILYAKSEVQAPPYTGVALYKDYMVSVPQQSGKLSVLQIELHPNRDVNPYYADVILNGLEVFKFVENTSIQFNRPRPNIPSPPSLENTSSIPSPWASLEKGNTSIDHQQGGDHHLMIVAAIGSTAAAFVIGACFYCLLYKFWQKEKGSKRGLSIIRMQLLPYLQEKNRKSPTSSTEKRKPIFNNVSNAYCRHFLLSEIVEATNNFDDALLLGVGGFGKVYKGEIDSGTKVAIKRGNHRSEQGVREFMNEIEMLSTLRHRHLVSLIGYCDDSSEMILVYNYMARGTLRQHFYGTNQPPLSWKLRLEICIGAAKALRYLHTEARYTLIHRDVKTTNILLDENWVAKVSDFGLSRMGTSLECSHVSTGVKGTFGYFDPEYFRLHRLTNKSDVYSFGVVMLELLCARPVVDKSRPMEEISLSDWALRSMKEGKMEQIIDPFLKGKIKVECLHRFIETAQKCLAERGAERPSMANVVSCLELALGLQISTEEENKEEELADIDLLDLCGDEDDDGATMSLTLSQTDEDISKSTLDVREIYEVDQLD